MTTPFDDRILLWHWRGGAVVQRTIDELAAYVRAQMPNASGIAIKTSNGRVWQGAYDDPVPAMAINGPESIATWVDELDRHGLETHLWCVVHGLDIDAEAARIIEACEVDGVRSMILDVEAGEQYFGSQPPAAARALIERVRGAIPDDFHLGLCLFARQGEPERIHIREWLPHVQSLHPMVYHWDFSRGEGEPEPYIDEAFAALRPYDRPLVPIFGNYADPFSGRPVPPEHLTRAAAYAAWQGAVGVSFFRLGAVRNDEAAAQHAAIRQIDLRAARAEPPA